VPTERAAYVLREAFHYPYRKIADILQVEEANARQLVTRARERVYSERRAPVWQVEQRRLLHAFLAAARTGDLARLERLFASDATPPFQFTQLRRGRCNQASTYPVNGSKKRAPAARG
jgi:sigma-70-like protein